MAPGHTRETILKKLKDMAINVKVLDHEAVPNMETFSAAMKAQNQGTEGLCKNLFFKVPSAGGKMKNRLFFVAALNETQVDVKALTTRIGVKASAALRFTNEEVYSSCLQVPQGSATPFCFANDTMTEVVLLIDQKFREKSELLFHPMINTSTAVISPSDFEKFINETCADRTRWIDFSGTDEIDVPDVGASASAAPKKEEPKKKAEPKPAVKKDTKQIKFAENHFFKEQAWEDGPFGIAHQKWLATQ